MSTLRRIMAEGGAQLVLVALIFVGVGVLFAFLKPLSPSSQPAGPVAPSQMTRAIDGVATAIDALASRIPVEPTAQPKTTSTPPTGTRGISPWWWALAALALGLLYYVFAHGGDDPWMKYIKRATAIAGVVTAVAGAYAAVLNAIAPRDDPLAIRRFIEFVPTAPQSSVFVLPNDISVVPKPEPKILLTFAIPHGEASCSASGRWPNTYPSEQSETFIRQLAAGLASCADATTKPSVEVRGFASSSEVRGYEQCGVDNTDAANLAIANRRGEEAAKLLREHGGSAVVVTAPPWESFEAMRDDREYNDRLLNNQYSSARATLTRRVEIRVLSAGACSAPPIPASGPP